MTAKNIIRRMPLIGPRFRNVEPTPEDVKEYWAYMQRTLNFRVVQKKDSGVMKAMAKLLKLMKVQDVETFMNNFTTVVPISGWTAIYTPFEVGVPREDGKWGLWSQIRICDHESDHILQCRAKGDLTFSWDYITNSASRSHYEAEAYRADLELEWKYRGRLLSPAQLAGNLVHYGVNDMDIKVTEKLIALSIPAVKRGAIIEPATKVSMPWLDKRFGFYSSRLW